MILIERVRLLAAPLADEQQVEIFDIEHSDGVLRVTIDKAGGVGIDEISRLTRALSRALDEADPLPGRYTLEVSSPGLERALRTPTHFQRAIGSDVNIKTKADVSGDRRLQGLLSAADEAQITVRDTETLVERSLGYEQIEKARTVFQWGSDHKPNAGSKRTKKSKAKKPAGKASSPVAKESSKSNDREAASQ